MLIERFLSNHQWFITWALSAVLLAVKPKCDHFQLGQVVPAALSNLLALLSFPRYWRPQWDPKPSLNLMTRQAGQIWREKEDHPIEFRQGFLIIWRVCTRRRRLEETRCTDSATFPSTKLHLQMPEGVKWFEKHSPISSPLGTIDLDQKGGSSNLKKRLGELVAFVVVTCNCHEGSWLFPSLVLSALSPPAVSVPSSKFVLSGRSRASSSPSSCTMRLIRSGHFRVELFLGIFLGHVLHDHFSRIT